MVDDLQRLGLGRQVVDALLSSTALKDVEKIYLMTSNSTEFYVQLGFTKSQTQDLLVIQGKNLKRGQAIPAKAVEGSAG